MNLLIRFQEQSQSCIPPCQTHAECLEVVKIRLGHLIIDAFLQLELLSVVEQKQAELALEYPDFFPRC